MSSIPIEADFLSSAKRTKRILVRLLPSLTDIAFLFPLATLFLLLDGSRTILADGDTGWHIRTGDWILQHGRVPQTDPFSFTKSGQSWFAWEWLWDVMFSVIHRFAGLSGVVLMNSLILSLVSALLYRLVRRHSANDARALVITLAAMCTTAIHWLGRPHLVSWILLLIAMHLIDRAQEGRTQLLWWFPLLVAFWANLHGSFPVALFLLFTYGAVNVGQDIAQRGFQELRRSLKRHRIWFLTCAASLAASLMNPYGWGLHQHVAVYLADSKQLRSIAEFMPFDFHSSPAIFIEAFLILGGVAAIDCLRRSCWAQAAILLVWAHLAFQSARNIPIFVFLAAPFIAEWTTGTLDSIRRAPVVAKWLRDLTEDLFSFGDDFVALERVERWPFIPVGTILLLALFFGTVPGGRGRVEDFDARDFPVAATRILAKHPEARVFTFDQWGDYLIYRLYPKSRVFVDGRSDFYGAEYSQNWVKAMQARFSWRKELERYSIDTVLLAVDNPLSSVLKETREWRPIFDDGRAVIFQKR